MSAPNSLVKRFTVAKPNHKGEENMRSLHEFVTKELAETSRARWVSLGWKASSVFKTENHTWALYLRGRVNFHGSAEYASPQDAP